MSFWHHLPRPIIGLAPMDGVTDIAFRHVVATGVCPERSVAKSKGRPDVIFTEFTNVHDICQGRVMGWEPVTVHRRAAPHRGSVVRQGASPCFTGLPTW